MSSKGFGRHIDVDGPDARSDFWMGWVIDQFAFTTVVVFTKASLLALYARFFPRKSAGFEVLGMAFVLFLWAATVVSL